MNHVLFLIWVFKLNELSNFAFLIIISVVGVFISFPLFLIWENINSNCITFVERDSYYALCENVTRENFMKLLTQKLNLYFIRQRTSLYGVLAFCIQNITIIYFATKKRWRTRLRFLDSPGICIICLWVLYFKI